ncbi:MAG: serine/threonine-protein kinase [Methylocella sp.]
MSPPTSIGQYRTTQRIATGGAGEVYAGIDTKVGREVAIKFLRPELASDPSYVDRFLAEAKSLGRLNHPNVATLYELRQEDDHVCMIMELVRGRTVEQIIEDRHNGLGIRESLAIIAQVADGLSYAHEQGVIHRDVKPSNLMATDSGRVKIMDFGIARVRGSDRMTRAGSAVGTPLYMSPEQCRGLEGDERSDIYSLAIVLYELLAGVPPFKGASDFELTKAHLSRPPPPLIPRITGVEPLLESAIMTALSKRPEQRFPSMRSFSDAAGATALRGDATGIIQNYLRPAQARVAPDKTAKRKPLPTVVVALVRSRAAAVARRFKGFHPAVRIGSAAALLLVATVVPVLLWLEPGPLPESPVGQSPSRAGNVSDISYPKREPAASRNEKQYDPTREHPSTPMSNRRPGQLVDQGRVFAPSDKVTAPADCDSTNFPGDCVKKDLPSKPPKVASREDADTQSFREFEAAEIRRNYGEALDIATKLDTAGDPAGAYGLGLLYARGEGVEADEERAFDDFHKAADRDYGMAQLKLGAMYHRGLGGARRDFKIAKSWYQKAAKNGVGEAMYALSGMCHRGEGGLTRDCEQQYLDGAAKAGYQPQ